VTTKYLKAHQWIAPEDTYFFIPTTFSFALKYIFIRGIQKGMGLDDP
jgi:hypothetical protein